MRFKQKTAEGAVNLLKRRGKGGRKTLGTLFSTIFNRTERKNTFSQPIRGAINSELRIQERNGRILPLFQLGILFLVERQQHFPDGRQHFHETYENKCM